MNVWVYLDSLFCSVGLFAYLDANTTWLVLVLRLFQSSFGILGHLHSHTNFRISLLISTKCLLGF